MSLLSGLLIAAAEQAPANESTFVAALIVVGVLLGVLVLPYLIGNFLAKQFRMPDHGWKLGLILVTLTAGIVICATGWPPNLGIDLKGGVILVYEVDPEEQKEGDVEMDKLIDALIRRVNPGGQKEVTVRPYGAEQVEIIIPEADEAELRRMKDIIQQVGSLEFRILANNQDHRDIMRLADENPEAMVVVDSEGNRLGQWVPVEKGQEGEFQRNQSIKTRQREVRDGERLEVLVVLDQYNVTGQYLDSSRVGTDPTGGYNVLFVFDASGARLFGNLTTDNGPDQSGFKRQLGIVLNGYLYSAPNINEPITGGRGEISGDFSEEEADALVAVLNAGSLPAALTEQPVSEMLIGPTLGADTIRRGAWAIGFSMVLVLVFMLIYYRFAGVVACGALLMTLVLILAVMITVDAALTLPGLAGLVLTVGMAVDANVLIFERIREELDRGAALRMAIRNGFQRATTTIVDANLTTLITAVILYAIGTDQIKGFALTLLLGVTLSMFTAIFCARVIFDIAEKRRWITQLKMMRLLGRTSIDFLRMRYAAVIVSGLVIAAGLAGVVTRGQGLLDIDFTGGVSVQIVLDEPHQTGEIREKLGDEFEDLAVSEVNLEGQPDGVRFLVNTSQGDYVDEDTGETILATQFVEQRIGEIFGDKLVANKVTITAIEPIVPDEVTEEPPVLTEPDDTPAGDTDPQPDSPAAAEADGTVVDPEEPAPQADGTVVDPEEPAPQADGSAVDPEEPAPQADGSAVDPEEPADADADAEADTDTGTEEPGFPPLPGSASSLRWLTPILLGQADGDTDTADADDAPATDAEPSASVPNVFAGGTEATLEFERKIDHDSLRDLFHMQLDEMGRDPLTVPLRLDNPEYDPGDSHPFHKWTVKVKLPETVARRLFDGVAEYLSHQPYFPSSSTIGSRVAGQMQQQAVLALLFSLICIVAYIWLRFQRVVYGLAAVVALVHDVLVTLGVIALSAYLSLIPGFQEVLLIDPFKIGLTVLAAFLTIIGYSLNDTIVVFDRIREVRGKAPRLTSAMINDSINQTLSRTLLTSLTTLIVVVILYFGGGQGIHAFAFALVIGVMVGTYSSIFVASPFLYWLAGSEGKREG